MNTKTNETKKLYIAIGTLLLAGIGLVIGLLDRRLLFNTFSLGSWLALGAFLGSLCGVRDHGSNVIAMLSYWLSFVVVMITVAASSLA